LEDAAAGTALTRKTSEAAGAREYRTRTAAYVAAGAELTPTNLTTGAAGASGAKLTRATSEDPAAGAELTPTNLTTGAAGAALTRKKSEATGAREYLTRIAADVAPLERSSHSHTDYFGDRRCRSELTRMTLVVGGRRCCAEVTKSPASHTNNIAMALS
jgi:hypothetical protein